MISSSQITLYSQLLLVACYSWGDVCDDVADIDKLGLVACRNLKRSFVSASGKYTTASGETCLVNFPSQPRPHQLTRIYIYSMFLY